MPRKKSLEELLQAAQDNDPDCVIFLQDELKLFEPNFELVKALVETDPNRILETNESGSNSLHLACGNIENMSMELLVLLMGKSPDAVTAANKFGLTPLHKAVMSFISRKTIPIIRFIAEAYPDSLMSRSKDGQLPLHIALQSPKLYTVLLVELLVELQPQTVRISDKYGQYPLHKAAGKTKTDAGIISTLLEAGRDIASLKDTNGALPLHLALSREVPNIEIVYLLVEAYPEGLFDPDYQDQLPYDKLMLRSKIAGGISEEVLMLMEFAREQMNSRKIKPVRVPSPNLR